MTKYISAKAFRNRLPHIADDLKQWRELVVLKHSQPLFKVVPVEDKPIDILDRAASSEDPSRPELDEIAAIVHRIRGVA